MAENKVCSFGTKCNKGTRCRFVHPEQSETASAIPKPKARCKFGANCKFGDKCHFDHSPSLMDSSTESPQNSEIVSECTFSTVLKTAVFL